jgi:hypothetical protein
MQNNRFSKWIFAAVTALLVIGIARASTNRYAERRNALLASLAAERQRLGLSDSKALFAQYPTPEITLCQPAHVAPGGTAAATVRGKFAPGTQFLFENDDVDVVKENATATEYHATVKAGAGVGPGYAQLHIFTPVSGGTNACTAVYIGGRYEWNFTAPNGWRIKVHAKGDPFPKDGSSQIVLYTVEFYRSSDAQPFEVRDLRLGLGGPLYGDSYGGTLEEAEPQGGASGQVDMQTIMQKLADPKLSDTERNQLIQQMAQQQQAALQNMSDPNYLQKQQQKQAEFGCQRMQFSAKADGVDGQVSCGQKVGNLVISGNRRFVGP